MFASVVKKPLHEVLKRSKRIADVGIEIEIEGTHLPSNVTHWQVKSEGSLKDGLEYITKPIKADTVKQYVDHLAQTMKNNNATVKNTYRCSTHVHVNMLPETVEDMLGYYVVFSMFEPLLLSLCGPQRDGNLFCMSSYDTGDLIESFDTLCLVLERIDSYGFAYERGKYSSLNSGRLADLGTLEVRCFPMSIDGTQVSGWVNWLLAIRDMARAESDKTYRTLWKNVRQNPSWYAQKIFGANVYKVPGYTSLVDFGTEHAYELTKVLKKWHNKKEPEPVKKKGFKTKSVQEVYADMLTVAAGTGGGSFFATPNVVQSAQSGGWGTLPVQPVPVINDDVEF